jgi:hypothetical protein
MVSPFSSVIACPHLVLPFQYTIDQAYVAVWEVAATTIKIVYVHSHQSFCAPPKLFLHLQLYTQNHLVQTLRTLTVPPPSLLGGVSLNVTENLI